MSRNTLLRFLYLVSLFFAAGILSAQPKELSKVDPVSEINISKSAKSNVLTGPTVYEQIEPLGYYGFVSHRFSEADFKPYTSEACDDFMVPQDETWEFSTIVVNGTSFGIAVNAVNVFIYNDDNGKPGTEATRILNHDALNFIGEGTLEIKLAETISLTEGNYWLSVQVVNPSLSADYSQGWMWVTLDDTQIELKGKPMMWRNPLDGVGTGFTDWTASTGFTNNWGEAYPAMDLSFGFYKERVAKDLGVTEIIQPENGVLGSEETISVSIFNFGTEDQTDFDVKYQIDGGAWVVETVGLTVSAGSEVFYTFNTTADLSEVKTFSINASTELTGEQNTQNDTYLKEVVNYGTIYKFTEFETLTVCGGTFTDAGGFDNWNAPMADTVTIYPDGNDLRTQLTFLEFDNGWSAFHIYDGEDVNAPEIDLTPGNDNSLYAYDTDIKKVVTAKNTKGALTIAFNGNYGSAPGWVATIGCFSPPLDDFTLVAAEMDKTTMWANDSVNIKVTIYNEGLKKQAKEVTYLVDGVKIGSVISDSIGSNETTSVSIGWTPASEGIYTLEVSIEDDGNGAAGSHKLVLSKEVFAEGTLAESFEGKQFPPEFWSSSLGIWGRLAAEYMPVHGDFYAQAMEHDTLVTPKLIIEDKDSISFMAMSQQWWFSTLDLYYSENPAGPWTFLSTVPLTAGAVRPENFTIDLSPAKGNNHIAFAVGGGSPGWAKDMMVDMVSGPKIYYHASDLAMRGIEGDMSPNQYDTLTYTAYVKNIGVQALSEGDYLVKFKSIDESGTETLLETKRGLPINHVQTLAYNFEYIPQDFGAVKLFVTVELSNDANILDNVSEELNVYVLPFGTDRINFGEAEDVGSDLPWTAYANYSVSQMFYTAEEIGDAGTIKGISYFYQNTAASTANVPVEIYMFETEDNNLANGFIARSKFVKMYEDTLMFAKHVTESREIFIPFNEPFIYTGKNLVIMVYKKDTETGYSLSFEKGQTNLDLRSYYSTFWGGTGVDLDNLEDYNNLVGNEYYHNSDMPNTSFFVNHSGMGEIAGVVYDENNKPQQGVELTIGGTQPVISDELGTYKFSVVPEGKKLVTAIAFGYNNQVSNTTVVAGAQTKLDFYMQPKPLVTLSGRVLRSDNMQGIEGIILPLVGYDNYETVTNANGEFIISDIYANELYVLTAEFKNFASYVNDTLMLTEGINVDLGDIVLQEVIEPVYGVVTNFVDTGMQVTWNRPLTGVRDTLDMGATFFTTGYTADVNEEIWMGNKFEVAENTTITSLNFMLWNYTDLGATNGQRATVELFNENQELIASVPVEMTQVIAEEDVDGNGTYEIHLANIPDVTVNSTFYAMVHWPALDAITPLLAHDQGNQYEPMVPDNAYYRYKGEAFKPLSSLIGSKGVFEITANTIKPANKKASGKFITGYNVYRGLASDMDNVENWEALNTSIISSEENSISFTDETWEPAEAGYYMYAVSSNFTAGVSEYSFSNALAVKMHSQVTFAVSSNDDLSVRGALVFLDNVSGNEFYSYNTKVSSLSGEITLDKVMIGEYNVKIELANYETFEQLVVVDEASELFELELKQIIMTPSNLKAENQQNNVKLSWTLGNETKYIIDNETVESALRIASENEAWIGNKFETTDKGYITSIELFGTNPDGSEVGNEKLSVDIFNAYGEYVGSSKPFILVADEWTTVEVPNVPVNGDFFAMVHWSYLSAESNYLAVDYDGSINDGAYYYDRENGFACLKDWDMPGVFLLRAVANIEGQLEVKYPSLKTNADFTPANLQQIVFEKSVSTKKRTSIPTVTYNIYLDDVATPVATGISELSYVLEPSLLTNGEGYYKAAVSAVYASGESNSDTLTFLYQPVSIVDLKSQVAVYPNPTTDIVNVVGVMGAKVELINLAGTIVSTTHCIINTLQVPVDQFESGIYLVRITSNNNVIVRKIEIVK